MEVSVPVVKLNKLSPVLVVDAIEPCLSFWVDRLGFTRVAEVPDGDRLGFVILQKDGIEVMYQTRASVVADHPGMAADLNGHSIVLFLTVDDLDQVAKAVAGAPLVKPRHKTFYGSEEIYVKEPGGHTVGFAQMGG